MLRYRNVVVVSDGLLNGFSMRAAAEFLKPIKVNRLIMVTPFASVQAVDQMHILADEIICLNVMDSIISIDHYYDDSTLPDHETVIRTIKISFCSGNNNPRLIQVPLLVPLSASERQRSL